MNAPEGLTEEQRAVTEAPSGARLLVTAGPGTGKTHVLISRLSRLIEHHNVSPGRGLLVLSFSRAAVCEISDRVRRTEDDAAYVRARTFDSFATRILSEYPATDDTWTTDNYDDRIQAAIRLVIENPAVRQELAVYEHVLVDEVQDLVGVRADFVKAILGCVGGGFTLLGDPAQGIYNFSVTGEERLIGSKALYNWVRASFQADLQELGLTINHRARTLQAKKGLWAGPALNGAEPDYADIKYRQVTTLHELPGHLTLESASPLLRSATAKTAILCRHNGQALMISRTLYEANVPHVRRASSTERRIPAWVAETLSGSLHRIMGKSVFMNAFAAASVSGISADTAWALLRRAAPGAGRDLMDLNRLEERLRTGYLPDELHEITDADLVVSTVHRAKGLEFENVLITESALEDLDKEETIGEECRTRYVALTRAKSSMSLLKIPKFKGLRKHDSTDRWIRKYDWRMKDLEVRPEDLHREDPAGGFLLKDCDIAATQQYLKTAVKPGDPVTLRLLRTVHNEQGQRQAFYAAEHNGNPIGVTSERFAQILIRILKLGPDWVVSRIEKLYVEGLETVGGTEAAAKRSGLGNVGIWRSVRISGMGQLCFEKRELISRFGVEKTQ